MNKKHILLALALATTALPAHAEVLCPTEFKGDFIVRVGQNLAMIYLTDYEIGHYEYIWISDRIALPNKKAILNVRSDTHAMDGDLKCKYTIWAKDSHVPIDIFLHLSIFTDPSFGISPEQATELIKEYKETKSASIKIGSLEWYVLPIIKQNLSKLGEITNVEIPSKGMVSILPTGENNGEAVGSIKLKFSDKDNNSIEVRLQTLFRPGEI